MDSTDMNKQNLMDAMDIPDEESTVESTSSWNKENSMDSVNTMNKESTMDSSNTDSNENTMPSTPVKPGMKRKLEFHSPPFSPSTPSASGKKDSKFGYILRVSQILRGGQNRTNYFDLYMQLNSGVQRITVYDLEKHPDLEQRWSKAEKVVVEAKLSLKDQKSWFVGEDCFVRKATSEEVPFEIDTSLKTTLIDSAASQIIDIKSLRKIDFRKSKENFTVKGKVTIGDAPAVPIPTSNGPKNMKEDIILEDDTGHINVHLFESQVSVLENLKTHSFTHMLLKGYRNEPFIRTSRDSLITVIAELEFESNADALLKLANRLIVVKEFTSIKELDIFDICPSCKKKMKVVRETKLAKTCVCGASTKALRLKRKKYSCKVELALDEDKFMWATLFSTVLDLVFPERKDVPTKTEIESFLFELEDVKVNVSGDDDRMAIIKINL